MDHYGYTLGRLLTAWNVLDYITWSEMHAIAMKWDELARTCDDLPWISPQYMTVRRVAARSAHNQRVLWSWHLVCSGPALPQQIDRWRLTARPACWGSKISFVFATSLRNFDNTKVIGTSTSHKALEQWSLFSSGYVRVWAQQNSWWLKSPGTYIYIYVQIWCTISI